MATFNIHEAKTQFSKLIDRAAKGEQVVIAKAGKAMVKLVPIDAPEPKKQQRIGFAEGLYNIPDDFDTMFQDEIIRMFEESEIFPVRESDCGPS